MKHFVIYLLYFFAFINFACEDPVNSTGGKSCEDITCADGEACQEDSQGNAYCQPLNSNDIPLNQPNSMNRDLTQDMTMNRNDMDVVWMPNGSDQNTQMTQDQGSSDLNDANTTTSEDMIVTSPDAFTPTECQDIRINLKPDLMSSSRVILAIDRSSSMVQDEDRWTPMQQAIEFVTSTFQDQIQFGLVFFPNPTDTGMPDPEMMQACLNQGRTMSDCQEGHEACLPSEMWIEPAFNNAESIRDAMLMWQPPISGLGTPTYSGLSTAGDFLANHGTAGSGQDFVLLATDGAPGCNFSLNGQTCVCLNSACSLFDMSEMCLDAERNINIAEDLAMEGIKTLVLGLALGLPQEGNACLGPSNLCPEPGQACMNGTCINQMPLVLDQMARAGRTSIGGRHLQVNDLAQLQQSLASITGNAVSCRYDLQDIMYNADQLEVLLDGMTIPRDPRQTRGWDIVDGALEFFGIYCEELRDGSAHTITATCN